MTVWLVGAGPGDPGLITVKGLEVLRRADVLLYDRLIAPELIEEAPAGALRIYVGKDPDGPAMRQGRINELLVEHGATGRTVVRLKGGDPFVFGQGGEEVAVLGEAGIDVQVIPGITSALAVPAAAGIPVSHREHASTIAIVAAHRVGDKDLEWEALATLDTVIFLMGAARIRSLCDGLMRAGRPAETPAAAVRWGTTDRQEELFSTLGELPGAFESRGFGAPSIIVVGEVVDLRHPMAHQAMAEIAGGA